MPLLKMVLSHGNDTTFILQIDHDDIETNYPMPVTDFRRISDLFATTQAKRTRRSFRPTKVHYAETLEDRRMLSATELVADINQQAPMIEYDEGIEIDGVFYFSGSSVVSSKHTGLWKYDPSANDGSGEATYLDGYEEGFSSLFGLTELEGELVFIESTHSGYDLWKWDPKASVAEQQLFKIADAEDGPAGFHFDLLAVDGNLYYRGWDENNNFELWRYTPNEGISMVATLENDLVGASADLVSANGKVYFHLKGPDSTFHLWEYDPAFEGPSALRRVVDQLTNDYDRPHLASVGGKVYFPADEGVHGVELWEFDPLANDGMGAVQLVADIFSWQGSRPTNFAKHGGKLYFQTWQTRIFELDPRGTGELGTIREIVPMEGMRFENSIYTIQAEGDNLYIWAETDEYKTALWRLSSAADGGSDEFTLVVDVKSGAGPEFSTDVAAFGNLLVLSVPSGFGYAFWVYDPLGNQGTGSVGPVRESISGTYTSQAYGLVTLGGKIYFGANDGVHGMELWEHDPLANSGEGSTRMVHDIFPGLGSSIPQNITVADGHLYFSAEDQEGEAIWRYQPGSDELDRLADIDTGRLLPRWEVLGGRLYFSADGPGGVELRYFDLAAPLGSGEVRLAADVDPSSDGHPYDLTAVAERLFFSANAGEFWEFDPRANDGNGAAVRIEIDAYGLNSATALTHMNGRLYFRGHSTDRGWELWEYEPSSTGSIGSFRNISDINPGSENSFPERLTAIDGKLYFLADDGTPGVEFWSFDPMAADGLGTISLEAKWDDYSFRSAIGSQNEAPLPTEGEKVFVELYRSRGAWSEEIWAFDTNMTSGSNNPTRIPGGAHDLGTSTIENVTPLGDRIYFVSIFYPIGHELFAIDIPPDPTFLDLSFSQVTTNSPGTVNDGGTPELISEWNSPTALLWLNVGKDTSELPFDLTIEIDLEDTWFGTPSVTSHLGTYESRKYSPGE